MKYDMRCSTAGITLDTSVFAEGSISGQPSTVGFSKGVSEGI